MKCVTKKLKNKTMNNDTYALRRKVINILYELKNQGFDLPRINVRITENKGKTLGVGRINANIIWIPERTLDYKGLHQTVYHEIIHTTFGLGHDETCPLMRPIHKDMGKDEALKKFKEYYDTWRKKHNE